MRLQRAGTSISKGCGTAGSSQNGAISPWTWGSCWDASSDTLSEKFHLVSPTNLVQPLMNGRFPTARLTRLHLLCAAFLWAGCASGTEEPTDHPLDIAKTPVQSGDQQSWSTGHNMPAPLRVIVTSRGLPVEGIDVTWSADPGDGILTPLIGVTGPDGIATARWTLSTIAGPHLGRASVDGAIGSPVSFSATAYPNFAFQVHIAGGDGQSQAVNSTLSEPFTVFVGDQFNNPFPGADIEWIVTTGQGTLSTAISTSDIAGLALTTLTLSSAPGLVEVLARFPGAATGPRVVFQATATSPVP